MQSGHYRVVFSFALVLLMGIAVDAEAQQLSRHSFWHESQSIANTWQETNGHRESSETVDVEEEMEEGGAEEAEAEEPEFEEPEFENPYDEPLETERHDFTQSTKVVGRGVVQLEYGVLFTTNDEGGEVETAYQTPEILLRCGLTDRLEFRTRFNYGWKFRGVEDDASAGEDLIFSLKYILNEIEPCSWQPETALELRFSAPTGGSDFTTDHWQGGFDLIYGWELGERNTFTASTGGNTNGLGDIAFINPEADREDQFMIWSQSAAFGRKLTDRTTGYFEWFGLYSYNREEELSLNFLNVGLDFLINNNALIDARIGWGLNEQSDDLFLGLGGAFRF